MVIRYAVDNDNRRPVEKPLWMSCSHIIHGRLGGASITASSTGDSYTGQDEAQLLCSGTPVTVDEATGGKFRLMFVHPEACVTDFGQRILRILNDKEAIQGLIVDEIHQAGKISCLIYLA